MYKRSSLFGQWRDLHPKTWGCNGISIGTIFKKHFYDVNRGRGHINVSMLSMLLEDMCWRQTFLC